MRVDAERLLAFVGQAFERRGVPPPDAATAAACLVEAELEGIPSHGLLRLPFLLRRLDSGMIAVRPELRIVEERAAVAVLDGGNGLGPVVGARAADEAVARARQAGISMVAVRRSNHLGSVGFYVRRMAAGGAIGLVFSNTPAAVAPPGGRRPLLGTNPIAAGFPTTGTPIVVDLATTQVARGRILKAARAGEAIPPGWALDESGSPTSDAAAGLRGSLQPLGGAKGFALALIVEVLSGVLGGSNLSPDVAGTFAESGRESNVGHAFLALDPDAFGAGFRDRLDGLAAAIRSTERAPGAPPVRVPGDRREEERRRRLAEGVEVPAALAEELQELAGAALA